MKKNIFKMNKTNIINIILISIMIISFLACIKAFDKVKLESFEDYFVKRANFNTEQVITGKEMFKKYKNISDYSYNMTLASLNYLPIKLLFKLKDSGLHGVISNCSAIEYSKDSEIELNVDDRLGIKNTSIDAFYMPSNKIFVSANITDLLNFDLNLVHEIGHAFDFLNLLNNKRFSQDDDFIDIYSSEEKYELFYYNDYYTKNEMEYFAESFSLYYINPTYLKNKAPKTYNYLKNILSNYES